VQAGALEARPPCLGQRFSVIFTGNARAPSAVLIVVIAVTVTRLRPAWRIAAIRFLRTVRSSRATSVRELPAAIFSCLDAPTRSPEIRSTDLARHASSHATVSLSPRRIARLAVMLLAVEIRGALVRPSFGATAGGEPCGPTPGPELPAVTVICTESESVAPPGSRTVTVAVYVPGAVYVCAISAPPARTPSPKSHTDDT
jgi:hypothetical protein